MTSIRHLYRIVLAGILFFWIPVGASAQNADSVYVDEDEVLVDVVVDTLYMAIADCFREIPDSLLPTLSRNNRLDMLDFMESKMKAEVTNRLGGKSEMTSLTDSTLSIQMSNALKVDMLLLTPESPADTNSEEVICMIETFGSDSLSLDSKVRFFTLSWELLNEPPQLSVSDKNTISSKKVQTILKWDEKILKKN
ncbi:MAG: DUF3256 family protein [Prevotella sp.]|nr:DUF3256 family protein [Prevotella sp.]MBO7537689.1 DUF3256 family protein [Prevotella sp.]